VSRGHNDEGSKGLDARDEATRKRAARVRIQESEQRESKKHNGDAKEKEGATVRAKARGCPAREQTAQELGCNRVSARL
jgi:hypothetical protein